jgi:hypothetical protein
MHRYLAEHVLPCGRAGWNAYAGASLTLVAAGGIAWWEWGRLG